MKKYLISALLIINLLYIYGEKNLLKKFTETFHPGDTLKYEFKWKWVFFLPSIKAGELHIKYLGEEYFKDQFTPKKKKILHFSAIAKSSGTLPKVAGIKIRDEFEIFVDPKTFTTILLIQNIHEGKRRNLIIERFFHKERKLLYRKFKIVDEKFYIVEKSLYLKNFPEIVHDPASVFFFLPLITSSGEKTPQLPIFFDGKYRIFNLTLKEDGFKKSILGKSRKTWKITVKKVFGGLKNGHGKLTIYFVKNPIMIPIYLEAKVKYGKVRGYLKEFSRKNN